MVGLGSRSDASASSAYAFLFTLGSGMSSVALPLIALAGGLGAVEIGLIVTLSALIQIATRANMGFAMRHLADRTLLQVAAISQVASFVVVLVSDALPVLTMAWALQGFARSCFWTCGQTHVVRSKDSSVGVLALFNFVGGIGQFAGPLLAGVIAATDLSLALVGGAVASALSMAPTVVLTRHQPFERPENTRTSRLLRRPGVVTACWASAGAGSWRSLMDSFVPVVLEGARYSSTTIGALVSVSNGAAVLGALAVGRMKRALVPLTYGAAMVGAASGMAAIGLVAELIPAAVISLAVSGFAAGMLQTLSPALASSAVAVQEQGEAIALSGTSRAVAMFAAPLVVTGATVVVPVGFAMLGVGLVLCAPAFSAKRRR